MNRNVELIKNTLILSIGTFVPKLMTLITLPILTACLNTTEYGNYDLILSLASLLIPVLTLQIQQAVFRHLISSKTIKNQKIYITVSLLFVVMSFLIFCPIIYLCLGLAKVESVLRVLICIMLSTEGIYYLIGQIVRGIGKNLKYSFSVIVYSICNMISIVVLVWIMRMGLIGVIISLSIGYTMSCVYMLVVGDILKYFDIHCISFDYLKELLNFSVPIVPSSISLWIVNLSDRLVVTAFLGAGVNGLYSVANKVPQLYSTAYNIFNLAWTETASRAHDEENPVEYYSTLFKTLYDFLIGIMLILIAVTPLVFKILVNQQFEEAYAQVPILYFGVFFNSIVQFYAGIYIAYKRTKQVGISSAVGAVINLVVNLMFVKTIGLYAASISTAVSYLAIVLFRAYDLNKVIRIKYHIGRICVGLVAFVLSAVFSYQHTGLSVCVCVVIAIVYNLSMNRDILLNSVAVIKRKMG